MQDKITEQPREYTLLNSATVLPLYAYSDYISIGGMEGKVQYIKDEDPYRIINGIRIGDEISLDSNLFDRIQVEVGVGYYIPLGNQWNAFIGDINTEDSDFSVLFFFKKRIPENNTFFMSYGDYKKWLNGIEFPED